jgi:hypothetical protein
MPFVNYQSAADVARAYHITFQREPFVGEVRIPLSDTFLSDLAFTLREIPFTHSEAAVSETLIFPMLRDVWRHYYDTLTLWSHQPIAYDTDLSGIPDYLVARRSPLGPFVLDQPYLLIMEAKRDDFERGWGQCLAAMVASQKLNNLPQQTIYGITTNGRAWEFGQLQNDQFTHDPRPFSLQNLDALAAALHFVFSTCRDQVMRLPAAA